MKYYVIAGEASGDLHGSYLLEAIMHEDNAAEIRYWGGDLMSKVVGHNPVKHIKDLAFMGFVEVVQHLGTIISNIKFCKDDISQFNPDVVVFVDYPGFNLRIAQWCKKNNLKTAYYISPQIWAWKENRIKKIKSSIDEMIVILPFEKAFYQKHKMEVSYVGHPLADIISKSLSEPLHKIDNNKPIIALLPGSRQQEIKKMLPLMSQVGDIFTEYEFYIAPAPNISLEFYKKLLPTHSTIKFASIPTYHLLRQSKAALVTSGTATLEVALIGTPEIVCYKGHPISVWLAKRLIKIKYISLVNLILDKLVVKEMIQEDFNLKNIHTELQALLDKNSSRYIQLQKDYSELKNVLSQNGAAKNASKIIVSLAEKAHNSK